MKRQIIKDGTFILSVLLCWLLWANTANAQNDCTPTPSGIIGWWPADDFAYDLAGTNDGTLEGGAIYTNGEVGEAFHFNGAGAYVAVPNSPLWAFGTNAFTVELWVRFNSLYSGSVGEPGAVFIGDDNGAGTQNKWFFAWGGGVLNFHINGPNEIFLVQSPFQPALGTWYHLAVTRTNNTFTIYTNGVYTGSQVASVIVPAPTAPLTIGQAEGFYFNGDIDEASIYSQALTSNEIYAIYSAGASGKCYTK